MSTIIQDPIDRPFDPSSQASVWPSALKWGAIAGGVSCVLTLLSYNLGWMDISEDGQTPGAWIVSLISIAIYVALMYVGLKSYRDTQNAGYLTFGRGMLWSLGFGLALGVISALFMLLFYTVLAPEYLEVMRESALDQAAAEGVDEASMEATETVLDYTLSAPVLAFSGFFGSLIMPLLIGLVLSLVLRNDK